MNTRPCSKTKFRNEILSNGDCKVQDIDMQAITRGRNISCDDGAARNNGGSSAFIGKYRGEARCNKHGASNLAENKTLKSWSLHPSIIQCFIVSKLLRQCCVGTISPGVDCWRNLRVAIFEGIVNHDIWREVAQWR